MSDLQTFLASRNIRQADFAEQLGTTQGTISKLINGAKPSGDLAARIEQATSGAIRASSWFLHKGNEDAQQQGAA